ncbi:hypothetical protein [Deinococcus roseus]|uniref:Uncharacterized protein n=1 Tax=Deinococcus roseus TaxID=392414 RepID=A0ABQ2DIH4_9DEIO|nr:hypothetical protein [Deinococcus roseus]GGJ56512.1 hypothetical protein GCM10008938_48350 [Deinococcus roseus]
MNLERLKKSSDAPVTGGSFGGTEPASSPASSPVVMPSSAPPSSQISGADAGVPITDLDPITLLVLSEQKAASGERASSASVLGTSPAGPKRSLKLPFAPLLVAGGALLCGAAALTLRGRHG